MLLYDRKTSQTEVISPKATQYVYAGGATVSADGRFVSFTFNAQMEVRDRSLKRTVVISAPHGYGPVLSASGRFVAYAVNTRTRRGEEDWAIPDDVYVHDLKTGKNELISVGMNGRDANDWTGGPSISPGGRYVVFASRASNLVPNDTNGFTDVFVRDRRTRRTRRVSISSARHQANADSSTTYSCHGNLLGFGYSPISADGRFIAFDSWATNLVASDTNQEPDVFVRGPLSR